MKQSVDMISMLSAHLSQKICQFLYPLTKFYEEGCFLIKHDGKIFCVVSPNGSIRSEGDIQIGVEIKFPSQTKNSQRPCFIIF